MPLIYLKRSPLPPPSGLLYTWGEAANGRLGNNQVTVDESSPIVIGANKWRFVTGDGARKKAIRSDGLLFSWGVGAVGNIGDGFDVDRSSPVQIGSNIWKAVSTTAHTLAIRSDGTLWTWGSNTFGQLGLGDIINRSSPVQIGSNIWKAVSTGTTYSHGIRADGSLWAWGNNGSGPGAGGMLGNSSFVKESSPIQIGALSWTMVSASDGNSVNGTVLAIRSDGLLFSWGENGNLGFGMLGTNQGFGARRSSPVQVGTLADTWKQVSVGGNGIVFAIKSDNTLWGWGANSFSVTLGVLGLNDTSDRSSPVQIGALNWTWVDASRDSDGAVAIRSDGTLWSWGRNQRGQLGVSGNFTRSSPIQVGAETDWINASHDGDNASGVRTT